MKRIAILLISILAIGCSDKEEFTNENHRILVGEWVAQEDCLNTGTTYRFTHDKLTMSGNYLPGTHDYYVDGDVVYFNHNGLNGILLFEMVNVEENQFRAFINSPNCSPDIVRQ